MLVYFFCGALQDCRLKIKRLRGNSEVAGMASVSHLCAVEYFAFRMAGMFDDRYDGVCVGSFLANKP